MSPLRTAHFPETRYDTRHLNRILKDFKVSFRQLHNLSDSTRFSKSRLVKLGFPDDLFIYALDDKIPFSSTIQQGYSTLKFVATVLFRTTISSQCAWHRP